MAEISPGEQRLFSERLRKAIGDESIRGFARRAKVSYGALQAYLSGNTDCTRSALWRMAAASGVYALWLMTGEGKMRPGGAEHRGAIFPSPFVVGSEAKEFNYDPGQLVEVPILSTVAALGSSIANDDERIVDLAVVYKSAVPHKRHSYAFRVMGDSMYPTIQDGFLVGVDVHPDVLSPLRGLNGKMVLARLDQGEDGLSIKWLRVGRTSLTFEAENPRSGFMPVSVPLDEANRIIARVMWWWGEQ